MITYGQSKKERIFTLNTQIDSLNEYISSSRVAYAAELTQLNTDLIELKDVNLHLSHQRDSFLYEYKKDSIALETYRASLNTQMIALDRNAKLPKCEDEEAVDVVLLDRNNSYSWRSTASYWDYILNGTPYNGWAKTCEFGRLIKIEKFENGRETGEYKSYYSNGQLNTNVHGEVTEVFNTDGSFRSKTRHSRDFTFEYDLNDRLIQKTNDVIIWIERNMFSGYIDGDDRYYSREGEAWVEIYDDGILKSKTWTPSNGAPRWTRKETYYSNGQIKTKERWTGWDSGIEKSRYDQGGKFIEKTVVKE